jgi:nitrate reductase gamma subunit
LAIWLLVSGVLVAIGIPSLIAGIGLLKGKGWARTLGMIVAVLALASFPVGTAAGIYTLWVLTQKETEQLLGASA